MARYAQEGHAVTALYLTRGEAGIRGKSEREAADIRTAEAEAACKILGANPTFAGQIDAATEVNPTRAEAFTRLIEATKADVLFTQWPIDTHPDHRACAALTLGAWVALKRRFALYYYEGDLRSDSQVLRPGDFGDIPGPEPVKPGGGMAHRSQGPQGFYNPDPGPNIRFPRKECGTKMAEAFVHH